MDRLRTPEECFANLPDFAFEPHFATVKDPSGGDPLRMAYLDEGPRGGDPVVLLHGEPTWSYLFRTMIEPLVDAGHRVIAPDLIGCGRSDKPTRREDHTFARHVAWVGELLLERLSLRDVTLVAHDWGSLVGLRLLGEFPVRFARVAIINGALPTGDYRPTDAFLTWQHFTQASETLSVGDLVARGCHDSLSREVVAAYDAPFPDETYKAGVRQFPVLVPTTPEDPAHDATVATWEVLSRFTRPFMLCYSENDPITAGAKCHFTSRVPGTRGQAHATLIGAGHFVPEDQGLELVKVLNDFIAQY